MATLLPVRFPAARVPSPPTAPTPAPVLANANANANANERPPLAAAGTGADRLAVAETGATLMAGAIMAHHVLSMHRRATVALRAPGMARMVNAFGAFALATAASEARAIRKQR